MSTAAPRSGREDRRLQSLRRRVRIAVELEDEQVSFLPREADESLRTALLEELVKARYPDVHEGRVATYGCIVVPDDVVLDDVLPRFGVTIGLGQQPWESRGSVERAADDALLRAVASGRTTFLVRTTQGPVALVEMPTEREVDMVRLVRRTGVFIVQRTSAGVVKAFGADEVWEYASDIWLARPYAESRLAELRAFTGRGSIQVTANLLDLCVHLLSDRHVGATLVWLLDEHSRVTHGTLAREGLPAPAELTVASTDHLEGIASLLAALDGACLLGQDGRVLRLGAHLSASEAAVRHVAPEDGTRHTSARRFSFDEPYALVFVVSADGRVTVYSDGVNVLYVESEGSAADDLVMVEPDLADAVTTAFEVAECVTCRKRLGIETTRITGVGGALAVECPICGRPDVAVAYDAFIVRALPLKPWDARLSAAS